MRHCCTPNKSQDQRLRCWVQTVITALLNMTPKAAGWLRLQARQESRSMSTLLGIDSNKGLLNTPKAAGWLPLWPNKSQDQRLGCWVQTAKMALLNMTPKAAGCWSSAQSPAPPPSCYSQSQYRLHIYEPQHNTGAWHGLSERKRDHLFHKH